MAFARSPAVLAAMAQVACDAVSKAVRHLLSFGVQALVEERRLRALLVRSRLHEGLKHVLHGFHFDCVCILLVLHRRAVRIPVLILRRGRRGSFEGVLLETFVYHFLDVGC